MVKTRVTTTKLVKIKLGVQIIKLICKVVHEGAILVDGVGAFLLKENFIFQAPISLMALKRSWRAF